MKLNLSEDFTRLPRAGSFVRAAEKGAEAAKDTALLAHDERHLRRRVLVLQGGGKVLVDLPEPVALEHGDQLVLDEGGGRIEIHAAEEEVYDIRARDRLHLAELCWHIGNRHLAAQIEEDRILILRDHVIRDMLTGLGATVSDVVEPFRPVRGAYSGHSHGHDHHHHHERDKFGRLPGDPHYGHSHA